MQLSQAGLSDYFFCRRGKNEGRKVLLTTDTKMDFMRVYEIYAMRWSIEVFFANGKRILGLDDCSARDSLKFHTSHW
ncbi:transposase [Bacteroides ovatus]|uniref:transposase n=1 Tax=Bacteroides ovatus TaxID=28116 RepID=UPI001C3773AB|nr:transposase [Bacteroides ovatus]